MSTQDTQLDELFSTAKKERVVFDQSQLRSVVEQGAPAVQTSILNSRRIRIMSILGSIGALTLTSLFLLYSGTTTQIPTSPKVATSRTTQELPATVSVPAAAPAVAPLATHSSVAPTHSIALSTPPERNTDKVKPAPALPIEGTDLIHLSEAELHNVGLAVVDNNALAIYSKDTKRVYENLVYFKGGVGSRSSFGPMNPAEVPEWLKSVSPPQPVAVSSGDGQLRMYTGSKTSSRKSVLNSLGTDSNSAPSNDITIYIYPNRPHPTKEHMDSVKREGLKVGMKVDFKVLNEEEATRLDEESASNRNAVEQRILDHALVGIAVGEHLDGPPALIAWYQIDDVLTHLPQRYADALRDVNANVNGIVSSLATESNQPIRGCRLMESCRLSAGAVQKCSVDPTPAATSLSFSMELQESRVCNIALYNLQGQLIQTLADKLYFSAGSHLIPLQLHNVENGIYLVSMVTDRGERTVHRIVVQH